MLVVQQVEVFFQHVIQVLKGVSLTVPPEQIVCLLGANGAGKSTTLKAISGLLAAEDGRVTDGRIEFHGERIDNRLAHEVASMGITQPWLQQTRLSKSLVVVFEYSACANF